MTKHVGSNEGPPENILCLQGFVNSLKSNLAKIPFYKKTNRVHIGTKYADFQEKFFSKISGKKSELDLRLL